MIPFIVFGAIAILVFGGGAAIVNVLLTREEIITKIREAAIERNFSSQIQDGLIAIAIVESDLNPSATKLTGGDGGRGGAWGLFQLTLTTARDLGFSGPGSELLEAEINIFWAMCLAAEISANTVEDLASEWNSGKRYAVLPDNHSTKTVYVPAVLAAMQRTV